MADGSSIVVFHRGALGDVVLIWPLLRALRAAGRPVMFISDGEKARLAARELGIDALEIERTEFNALWRDGSGMGPLGGSVELVISSLAPAGSAWAINAAAAFPGARIDLIEAPLNRNMALALVDRYAEPDRGADGDEPSSGSGPVLLHVGAGSAAKRWPMERWRELAAALRDNRTALSVSVIAGEVEAERFNSEELAIFRDLGGRFEETLEGLADAIKAAKLVVGADSGPMHLAAQVGRATLTLFGPTDPSLWAPIGRTPSTSVRVLAPMTPAPMTWLGVERVIEAVHRLP